MYFCPIATIAFPSGYILSPIDRLRNLFSPIIQDIAQWDNNLSCVIIAINRRHFHLLKKVPWLVRLTFGLSAVPECPTWQMENDFVRTVPAECGVILSPNFPGLVGQGLWSWTLQCPDDAYLILDVYYVRGPAASESTTERLRSKHLIGSFIRVFCVARFDTRFCLQCLNNL